MNTGVWTRDINLSHQYSPPLATFVSSTQHTGGEQLLFCDILYHLSSLVILEFNAQDLKFLKVETFETNGSCQFLKQTFKVDQQERSDCSLLMDEGWE